MHRRYKEIRTSLNVDDYVRIGGYIATLDSLGIQSITVSACMCIHSPPDGLDVTLWYRYMITA